MPRKPESSEVEGATRTTRTVGEADGTDEAGTVVVMSPVAREDKQCPECGLWFTPKNSQHKYCCKTCERKTDDKRYHRKNPRDNRVLYKAWRRKMAMEGRCTRCGGKNPEQEHYLTCPECRDEVRTY